MKHFLTITLTLLISFGSTLNLCANPKRIHKKIIVLETSFGDIEIRLSKHTPLHSANFLKLVEQGYYDGVLFHRVIEDFMIQGGDPDSRGAEPGVALGEGGPDYTIPGEFDVPRLYHKRGVIAAARESDDENPKRESSGSQFYIVWGKVFDDAGLAATQERVSKNTDGKVVFSEEMKQTYQTLGGTPHLDGQYTVFGEVISGMEIVEEIQKVETDDNDRPTLDIAILRAYVK